LVRLDYFVLSWLGFLYFSVVFFRIFFFFLFNGTYGSIQIRVSSKEVVSLTSRI